MAANTVLNTILRDAAKTPLLTGERNCVHPGDDVRDSFTGSQDDGGPSICGRECEGSGGGGVSGRGGSRQAPALRPAIIQ